MAAVFNHFLNEHKFRDAVGSDGWERSDKYARARDEQWGREFTRSKCVFNRLTGRGEIDIDRERALAWRFHSVGVAFSTSQVDYPIFLNNSSYLCIYYIIIYK